jgi:isoleucyl-tRNA synthetase
MLGNLSGLIEENDEVNAVIWTTTPWTLPANRVNLQKTKVDIGHRYQSGDDIHPSHYDKE